MRRLPGSHPANIKNRSSKQLGWLCGVKPFYKTLSNEALAEFKTDGAAHERRRRDKKNAKKDMK